MNEERTGEKNPNSVLTEEKVLQIRKLKKDLGMGSTKLSKMFGVSKSTIEKILRNEIWKNKENL